MGSPSKNGMTFLNPCQWSGVGVEQVRTLGQADVRELDAELHRPPGPEERGRVLGLVLQLELVGVGEARRVGEPEDVVGAVGRRVAVRVDHAVGGGGDRAGRAAWRSSRPSRRASGPGGWSAARGPGPAGGWSPPAGARGPRPRRPTAGEPAVLEHLAPAQQQPSLVAHHVLSLGDDWTCGSRDAGHGTMPPLKLSIAPLVGTWMPMRPPAAALAADDHRADRRGGGTGRLATRSRCRC